MSLKTAFLNLFKPETGDKFSITGTEGYNKNMDLIDAAVNKNTDSIAQLKSELEKHIIAVEVQDSSEFSGLINNIIATIKSRKNGIYNIYGSWKEHPNGYSAIVQKVNYHDNSVARISGSIYAFNGNGWNFTANVSPSETRIKSSKFTMS